jgi:hypothetical protein
MEDGNSEPKSKLIQEEQIRKPYSKPTFRFERAFETTALSCGKVNPNQLQCKFNRKVS